MGRHLGVQAALHAAADDRLQQCSWRLTPRGRCQLVELDEEGMDRLTRFVVQRCSRACAPQTSDC